MNLVYECKYCSGHFYDNSVFSQCTVCATEICIECKVTKNDHVSYCEHCGIINEIKGGGQ